MRLIRPLFGHVNRLVSPPLFFALFLVNVLSLRAQVTERWDQAASSLADQVASVLGAGQVRISLRNLSSVRDDEVPAIRRLLEADLKAHGITASGEESANALRITLSENTRQRIWVAEIVEGTQTQVVMVTLELPAQSRSSGATSITLNKQSVLIARDPIVAALEAPTGLVTLEPEEIAFYPAGEKDRTPVRFPVHAKRALARDPRGILLPSADQLGFAAFLPGLQCEGSPNAGNATHPWAIRCAESDDPWPIVMPSQSGAAPPLPAKAFYNAARNNFSGIVVPSAGMELPAFYSAAAVPRPGGGAALLINGIDGKLQLIESGAMKPIAGARDWGSDFTVVHTGCGSGTQIIVSGSGPAAQDSLRAYELPALEAVPVSTPLAMEGTVTVLWPAPDGKGVLAITRNAANEYEVDRVTAICN